jgi:cell division ATPase FtsA
LDLKAPNITTEESEALKVTLGELKGELAYREKLLEDKQKEEDEANPEAAAKRKEAEEIAARKKEEASRLPTAERDEIKNLMATVFASGD